MNGRELYATWCTAFASAPRPEDRREGMVAWESLAFGERRAWEMTARRISWEVDGNLRPIVAELAEQNESLRRDMRKMREERDRAREALDMATVGHVVGDADCVCNYCERGRSRAARSDESRLDWRAANTQIMVESIPMLDELDARVAKLESAVLLPSQVRGNSA